MNTTTTPVAEVATLPLLNADRVTAGAAAWVESRLEQHTTSEDVAQAAARLVIAEEKAAEKARADRDRCAYTIERDYKLRRGANLAGALGVRRSRLMVIRREQAALDAAGEFTPTPDPLKALPRLAEKAAAHAARIEYARIERDAAVAVLLERGTSNAEIARIIGRDPSRVSHLKYMPHEQMGHLAAKEASRG